MKDIVINSRLLLAHNGPTSEGGNGYRYYDDRSLIRLQRILLLRQLGLELRAIGEALLRDEQRPIAAQITSVERTVTVLAATGTGGRDLMTHEIFDGFDHTQHKQEVEQRWGKDTYAKSDQWWQGLGDEGRDDWKQLMHQLGLGATFVRDALRHYVASTLR